MTQKEKDLMLAILKEQLEQLRSIEASLELQLIDLENRKDSLPKEVYEKVKAGIEKDLKEVREQIQEVEKAIEDLEALEPDE